MVVQDPTGHMEGTLQRKVLDQNPAIRPGTVFVLRKVSVFNPSPNTHYLNIVSDNVQTIFTTEDSSMECEEVIFLNSYVFIFTGLQTS